VQNLASYSCSATLISYIGNEISRLSRYVIEIPIFGYFGVLTLSFLGYLVTSDAKSDVIFLLSDPDFLLRRRNLAPISLSYRDPHFWLFRGSEVFWGYLATSDAKFDVIFLLSDPNFLLGRRSFAPISISYRDPHFWLFGGSEVFWGIKLLPMQNLTSHSCSLTPIS